MADRQSLWLYFPQPLRELPADLAALVLGSVFVNIAVFAPVLRDTPLRIPLGLAFVLFIPGYAFIAALFPEAGESPHAETITQDDDAELETGWMESEGESDTTSSDSSAGNSALTPSDRSGIDGIERVALSFGLSIAIVPLLGLVLNFTPWGIRLVPIMITVTGFTVLVTAIAAVRRWRLPEKERFNVPYREWYRTAKSEVFEPETRFDGVLNVLLALSVVLALGTVTFAIVVPPQGEQFSAVYILTEDDDGDLVASDYPTEFVHGESQELVVGIDNDEHETMDYTIVALEQTAEIEGNETVITEERELDRIETTIDHNESYHHEYDLEPTITGDDVRILWLMFPEDDVPSDPSTDDTEYHAHLWVTVEEEAES
ncbi:DUF1616 domain-containing protein [Halostagnicola sp. A-GB9-2]|uniref:DUF1616 domain-containing protein n=1 Tax=Halostagnicola sp. A-GB9-2 TaxID=3048066 RepID=UPI0024C04CF2|nr:DUF1616 domain-containing protein [Halostagnicola sp. A-GB9-2]MDJ1434302.1 DUF1616 domain-containing protein [Halostagnicola sp. A-GB9-2]